MPPAVRRTEKIAVVRLNSDYSSGTVVREITSGQFLVPTTLARFGSRFYLVNARFGTPETPTTEYWITAVRRT